MSAAYERTYAALDTQHGKFATTQHLERAVIKDTHKVDAKNGVISPLIIQQAQESWKPATGLLPCQCCYDGKIE